MSRSPPGGPHGPDSYRPPPLPSQSHYPSHQNDRNTAMYHFRGNEYLNHDENHPPTQSPSRSPQRYDTSAKYRGDSYRPKSNGFSFNMEPPPSIDLSRMPDSYRPMPPRSRDRSNGYAPTQRDGHHHGTLGRGGAHGRGGFPRKAAERPFLQSNRAPTPELMPGMDEDDGTGVRYRVLEDISSSDEADMDVSSNDENQQLDVTTPEQPKKKHARTELNNPADGDSVPRWSNPDPYTALPPQDESQRKKLDVVKLIRKARVVNLSDVAPKTEIIADDFISFDFDDSVIDDDDKPGSGVPGAPTGPRAYSHLEHLRKLTPPSGAVKTNIGNQVVFNKSSDPQALKIKYSKHESSNQVVLDASDPALGSRKRTFDDEIKDIPHLPGKNRLKQPTSGSVVKDWEVVPGSNEAPWCTVDHSLTANMGYWLHKEIMDFYHHVKPTAFDDSMRSDLVHRLRAAVRHRWNNADIQPFGSFVAGLYLPTSDMDIVLVSNEYLSRGRGIYNTRKFLFQFRDFLQSEGIPAVDSVEVIAKAKVPLVKYVDKKTGLKVDISFENDTGLVANRTFKDWKIQYPAMPTLVTLIKQFLAMRGLNEPVNGGIGGFTVTCLVISLLQLMPQVQSGNMIPEHHLGEVLMEFLDLYGNEFDAITTAIQFDPPGYVSKSRFGPTPYKRKSSEKTYEKLSIIDPNNSMNDIAGGSKNTPTILRAFSRAFRDLQKRMSDLRNAPIDHRRGQSILSVILGGNYSSFDVQRDRLRKCCRSWTES